MKKAVAILMMFVVLLGTMTRDVSSAKATKSAYSVTDSSDKDDSPDNDNGDTKDAAGKEVADKFHFHHHDFLFHDSICNTLFQRVAINSIGIDHPYLESISLPPEIIS